MWRKIAERSEWRGFNLHLVTLKGDVLPEEREYKTIQVLNANNNLSETPQIHFRR